MDRFLDFVDEMVAFLLRIFGGVQRVVQARAVLLLDLLGQSLVKRQRRQRDFVRLELVMQLADGGDDALDLFVPEARGVGDGVFGDFERAGLDHHNGFFAADHDDIQQAGLLLGSGGVGDELAFEQADAHGGDRAS